MAFLKAVIFTTLATFLAVFAFLFFTFDTDYQLNSALDFFLKEEYEKSAEVLSHLEGELRPSEMALYRAYLMRGEGLIEESNQQLQLALSGAKRLSDPKILLEIHLNRAFNHFLLLDDESFVEALDDARTVDPQQSMTKFFAGLEAYLKEDFEKALKLWATEPSVNYMSVWMQEAFTKTFTPSWRVLHIAHCTIEQGKYLTGRKPLEKIHQDLVGEERFESAFLIGLSYAKEAETKPLVAAMPYYQVAQSYFEEVPVHHEKFARERVRMTRQLRDAAKIFIDQQNLESMGFFVNILESWEAKEELEDLSKEIMDLLNTEIDKENWSLVEDLATLLNRLLKDGEVRQSLSKRFHNLIEDILLNGELSKLSKYWQVSLLLSENPTQLIEDTSGEIAKKILKSIEQDGKQLDQANLYVSYWNTIERDSQKRFLFAKQLVLIAGEMWTHKGSEAKAIALMKLAESLPYISERQHIHEVIATELQNIYTLAAQADDIERLTLLVDTARHFHMDNFGKAEKTEVANQLEDASYLMKMGRYLEAQKRLVWILKVNAEHQQARRLLGLAFYQQGKYLDALKTLNPLMNKDRDIKEVIAICQIASGESVAGKKTLERLGNQHPLSDHGYLQLGFLSLMDQQEEDTLKWLKNIRRPHGEVLAYLCVAAYKLTRWKEAVDYFYQLPTPYSRLPALRQVAIRSFIELENIDLAEGLILQMNNEEVFDLNLLPERFQQLSQSLLEDPNPKVLAGKFYQGVLKNHQKALEYFNEVKEPSLDVLLMKGEAHYSLGHYKEAEFLLKLVADDKSSQDLSIRAMAALADVYSLQHRYDQALMWYRSYFEKGGRGSVYRLRFAKALSGMMLWKDSSEQYAAFQEEQVLSDDDTVLYGMGLLFAGQVHEAARLSRNLLEKGEALSALNRIRLLRLVLKAGDGALFQKLSGKIGDQKSLGVLEKQELASLFLELGQYDKARDVVAPVVKELKRGTTGLMVLAKLHERLGQPAVALSYAHSAFSINPYDREAAEYISDNETDLKALARCLEVYDEQVKSGGGHLLAKLGVCRFLLALVREKENMSVVPREEVSALLQRAFHSLQEMKDRYKAYPEVFFLLGKAFSQSKDLEGAQHSFEAAVRMHSSYTQAFKDLSKIYEGMGELHKALKSLETALRFSRDDVQSWVKLAQLNMVLNDVDKVQGSLEQARRFSLSGSEVHKVLNTLLLDVPQSSEQETKDAAELLSTNIEALQKLLQRL